MESKILRLNLAGQPLEWLDWQACSCLYARGLVAWSLGAVVKRARGGRSRLSGLRSFIDLPAIVASDGECYSQMPYKAPLTNRALFQRDHYRCLYCGHAFRAHQLSRDHVFPRSRGGEDKWENVVAACQRCNHRKGSDLLTDIDMTLLALPYRPNLYEYMALINSQRIHGDQMAYLRPQFSQYQLPVGHQQAIALVS